jgi:hypothetical protein
MARARRKVSGMRLAVWQSLDRWSLPPPNLSPDIGREKRGKQFSRLSHWVAMFSLSACSTGGRFVYRLLLCTEDEFGSALTNLASDKQSKGESCA